MNIEIEDIFRLYTELIYLNGIIFPIKDLPEFPSLVKFIKCLQDKILIKGGAK